MKHSVFSTLICLLLSLTFLFSGCTEPVTPPEDSTSDSTADSISDTTDDSETEPAEEPIPQLTPVIDEANRNLVIAQLRTPVTVEILDGVTVDLRYQGWPTICRGEGNTLYAVSSLRTEHVDPFGAVAFYESKDGGETWSDPQIIVDTPLDDRDAGIVYLGDGHLMVTWFNHTASKYLAGGVYSGWRNRATAEQVAAIDKKYTALPSAEAQQGSYVIHSTDGGKTWDKTVQIPVTTPHGPTLMQDGKTLMVYGTPWSAKKVLGFDLSASGLYVFKSADGGYTWKHMSTVTLPMDNPGPGKCCEPSIVQLKDGSFVSAYRNEASEGMSTYVARSEDGKKWTLPEKVTDVPCGPPHLLELDNGAVLLNYGYRKSPQCGIRAKISYDRGVTWSEEFVICEGENSKSSDLGYPSTVQMDDGTLITAYYASKRGDSFCSLLYTKWALEPVD